MRRRAARRRPRRRPGGAVRAGDPDRPGTRCGGLRGRDRGRRLAGAAGTRGGHSRLARGDRRAGTGAGLRPARSSSAATGLAGRGPWSGRVRARVAAAVGARPASRTRRTVRSLAGPLLDLRRWLLWPHTVRGWWAALRHELAPADLYHACGALTIAAALDARRRDPVGPSGRPSRVVYDVIDLAAESNAVTAMPRPIRPDAPGRTRLGPRAPTRSSRSTRRSPGGSASATRDARSRRPEHPRTGRPGPGRLAAGPHQGGDRPARVDADRPVPRPSRPGSGPGERRGGDPRGARRGPRRCSGSGGGWPRAGRAIATRALAGRHLTLDARPPDEIVVVDGVGGRLPDPAAARVGEPAR